MTERPTFVDIGPHRFAIHWDQASLDRERVRDKHDADGNIRYSENKINITPGSSVSYQRELLLHEILHGALGVTGGNRFPKKASVDDILQRFDALLLDTLRRNPHVVAWLTAQDDA